MSIEAAQQWDKAVDEAERYVRIYERIKGNVNLSHTTSFDAAVKMVEYERGRRPLEIDLPTQLHSTGRYVITARNSGEDGVEIFVPGQYTWLSIDEQGRLAEFLDQVQEHRQASYEQ